MGYPLLICLLCVIVFQVKSENKYSKDANINYGKSNILYESDINVRTLDKPFRMAKLNLLWTKAQVRLTETKLKSLFSELKIHDKEELTYKKLKADGSDKEGLKEAELRKKLIGIMSTYGLLEHFDDVNDPSKYKMHKPLSGPTDTHINRSLFKDKKLNKLWEKAESAGFTAEELQTLREEFNHHQDKIDQYNSLLNNVDTKDDQHLNSIDEKLDRFNMIDKQLENDNEESNHIVQANELRDKHMEIRDGYDRLHRMSAKGPKSSEFVEPKVEGLWRMATQANFSSDELESLKDVDDTPKNPHKKAKLEDSLETQEEKRENATSPKPKETQNPSNSSKKIEKDDCASTSPKNLSLANGKGAEETISKGVSLKDKSRSPDSKKVNLGNEPREIIKQLFLVTMPEDFYSFWEMCKSLNASDPSNALKAVKLKLVGPFDVLAGNIGEVYEEDLSDYLIHWRYYYDPPEFQTVLASEGASCYHMGYYRDDPKDLPVFVASNALNTKNPEKNGELKIKGQNLFSAFNAYLEELKTDPFSRMKIPKFQNALKAWAKEKGFSLEKNSKEMDSRSRKVNAKTFHGAGIVVPFDKKTDVGYRELAETNSMIKKILKGIVESKNDEERKKYREQLQPVITFANIANDECDFGTSLELGLDLFTYGSPLLHGSVKQLLTTAYSLLGRLEFKQIIEAHLENRQVGGTLSKI